jgi:transcriptional regulator with XRE-family HTH domain
MENIREILANNLKENRRRLGISQPKLAEISELSTHYVSMIESTRKFPTPEVLGRLATALKINTHELFAVPVSTEDALERLHLEVVTDIKAILGNIEKIVSDSIQKAIAEKCK